MGEPQRPVKGPFKSSAQYQSVHTCEVTTQQQEKKHWEEQEEKPSEVTESKVAPATRMERPPNRQALGKVLKRASAQIKSYSGPT